MITFLENDKKYIKAISVILSMIHLAKLGSTLIFSVTLSMIHDLNKTLPYASPKMVIFLCVAFFLESYEISTHDCAINISSSDCHC